MKKLKYMILCLLPIVALVILMEARPTKSRLDEAFLHGGGGSSTSNVTGGSATSTTYEQPSFTVTAASQDWATMGITYKDKDGNVKNYGGSKITVSFANQNYTAYCLDPQLALPQGELVCNPINYNPQINAFMNEIGGTSGSDAEIQENQLMFRIWAAIEGWTIGSEDASNEENDEPVYDEEGNIVEGAIGGSFGKEQKDFKNTVKEYYKVYKMDEKKINMKEFSKYCDGDCDSKDEILTGMIGDQNGSFKKAFDKAVDVIENNEAYAKNETEDIQGQVRVKIIKETKTEVEFELQSLVEIDGKLEEVRIPTLTVQCVEGCAESGFTKEWNGTKGTYKIKLLDDVCEYKINLYYDTKGAYECSTNDPNTQTLYTYIDKVSTEAVQQIKGMTPGCEENCCNEAPLIDPDFKNVDVNNCCSPTTSTVEEYKLNELFCYDKDLKVEHYDPKCNSEVFMTEVNQFCEMYCTEKVTVDLPGAITATSGRYFTLTKNPKGTTTSPYITGTKRCRILTDMREWFNSYTAQVNQQVEYFNLFQEFSAIDKMVDEILATEEEHTYGNVKVTCEPDQTSVTLCGKRVEVDCEDVETNINMSSYKLYNYTYMPGADSRKKYYTAKITEGLIDSKAENSDYENLKIEIDKLNTVSNIKLYTASKVVTLSYAFDKRYTDSSSLAEWQQAAQEKVDNYERSLGKCTVKSTDSACTSTREVSYSCEREQIAEESSSYLSQLQSSNIELNGGQVDFREIKNNITQSIQRLNELYNGAATTAKKYEDDLNTCHNYFDKIVRGKENEFYKFNPKQSFSYTQSYLDETGKLVSDNIEIDFASTPGCKPQTVQGTETTSDDDIDKSLYSEVYKDKDFTATDLKDMGTMIWIHDKAEFEQFKDEEYEEMKYVRNDGKVVYICEWDEGKNTIYTLAQSGVAVEDKTSLINYTIHEREYQIYLSTLEGTYETFWDISGLGEKGRFDKYFNDAGSTCAGENPESVAMFTCKLQVEHEVVLTGYCNGVTNGTENCDPFKEGYELVNFKVVDPVDLFPSVPDGEMPSHNGETYGYNWIVDPEGQEVLGEIEETGAEDKTYAPENLSYSFKLTPTDMKHIKNYNESRISLGGYTDFNLTCVCPDEINSTESCTKCRSTFVENLSKGLVKYGSESHDVSGWANPEENLGTVRDNNHW